MNKKFFISFIFLIFSQILIFSQSRIPGSVDNYLSVASDVSLGGRDLVNVIFFEVPDTITSTLYFAIHDPEANAGDLVAPDITSGVINTTYTLIGGTGTLSDSRSRQSSFGDPPADHKIGTTLSEYVYDNTFTAVIGQSPGADNSWVYFPGVSPSQGEHIGNKYYFKVVAQGQAVGTLKNAYQLDISLNNSGTPTGIADVRSFAYSWMVTLEERTGNEWNMYPFVPDTDTGTMDFHNYDMDNGEALWISRIDRSDPAAGNISGNNIVATTSRPLSPFVPGVDVNGTWELKIIEVDDGAGTDENITEFWASNSVSGEESRIYSAQYTPTTPDHIALDSEDGSGLADGTDTETVTVQIVDSTGNPLPYMRKVFVEVSGSARINNVNGSGIAATSGTYVTTDSQGLGTIAVIDTVTETTSVTITSNGNTIPGTDADEATSLDFPGTHETIDITFVNDIMPVISSAQNISFTEGNPQTLTPISISDSASPNIIAANATGDIRIRIPSGLDAVFNTGAAVTPVVTGTGTVNGTVAYESGNKIVRIDVTTNFLVTDTLVITGLSFTAGNTASTGHLEASFNNGATYTAIDDKFITILSPSPTYIWDGSDNINWSDGNNWVGNVAPAADTDNIIIPYVSGFMPTLDVPGEIINNLTIGNGAILTINNLNFTINGDFSNDGTLALAGGQTLTYANDTNSGLILYTGAGAGFAAGNSYFNVGFSGPGPADIWSPGTAMTVNGTLSISPGNSLSMGANNLTTGSTISGAGSLIGGSGNVDIGGNITISNYSATSATTTVGGNWNVGAFTHNNGTIEFDGNSSSTLTTNNQSMDNIIINKTSSTVFPGGSIDINGNLTITSGTFNTANNNITIAGNWSNSDTFIPGTGTVTFDTTATSLIAGNTTFYNLTCTTDTKTIRFTAGTTQTVTNIVTIQGTSGNEIVLESSIPASEWFINAANSNISYVAVSDSNASGGSTINAPDSIDNTNNTNWNFLPGPTITSVTANDPDDLDSVFGDVDTITFVFSEDTNQPFNPDPTMADLDTLFGTMNLGADYTGTWSAADTLVITINDSTGGTAPVIGTSTFTLQAAGNLRNAAGTSLVSTDESPAITGDWGTFATGTIQTSWTEDTDNNGKIDRIGADVGGGLGLNDNFSGVRVSVAGYSVLDVVSGSTANDTIFYIEIDEGPGLDTDATPPWWFDSNTTLAYSLTSQLIESSGAPAGETPIDQASPIIGYTLAVADKDEIFICFSEPVQTPGGGVITLGDFTGYSGSALITSRTRITTRGNGTKEVLLTMNNSITSGEIVNGELLTVSALEDSRGLSLVSQTHRVTDIGLGLADDGIIQPVWARDETNMAPDTGPIGYINLFDNSEYLRDQNITVQAHIHDDITGTGLGVRLYFDVNVSSGSIQNRLWLPTFPVINYNGVVPFANPGARVLAGTEVSSQLRNFTIPGNDSEIEDSAKIEFLFEIQSAQLYCTRIINPDAGNWYRTLSPWAFTIRDIIKQKSDVTILNNVINPLSGERTYLHYILTTPGTVSITVFDLKGDIVALLFKAREDAGEYSVSWDGRNRSNRIVARGIYFIKIVAPKIDEIRKVLVVK